MGSTQVFPLACRANYFALPDEVLQRDFVRQPAGGGDNFLRDLLDLSDFYKCLGLRPERSKQMGSYWVVIIGASALPNPNRFSPFATAVTPSEQLRFGVAHSAFRFPPAGSDHAVRASPSAPHHRIWCS